MPPSVADWLPEDHLAWFVLDVVEELDLSAFYAIHRDDGRGGSSYHPRLMLSVLLFAYCTGERSSRRIERRLVEDVAYRVLAANQAPDHATVARFRRRHEEAIAELFVQVLGLCVTAGIVDSGLVAIDGTKVAANASQGANRTRRQLVEEILAEAEQTDAEEDAAFGERRGDELPEAWSDRTDRRSRIAEALRQLDAEGPADFEMRVAAREQRAAAAGHRPTGPALDPNSRRGKTRRLANTTDPDSRAMSTAGRGTRSYVQGFNAQAAATVDQVIVAAEVTKETNDLRQFVPLVQATNENLSAAGHEATVGTFVADAGYWSTTNALFESGSEVLIPTVVSKKGITDLNDPRQLERQAVVERVDRGELTLRAAGRELGLTGVRMRQLLDTHRGVRPDHVGVRVAMDTRLAEETAAARYAKRKQMIEPVFGNIKENKGYRRFSRRGLNAVRSEWRLICATHNLLKLRRMSPAASCLAS
jgi:transposase